MIVMSSSETLVISSRRSSISGSDSMARVTSAAKISRSTVSACPPGTRARSARRISRESSRRSSSFSSHDAEAPGRISANCCTPVLPAGPSDARRPPHRPHFVQNGMQARARHLPRGLRARQASSDDVNRHSFLPLSLTGLALVECHGQELVPLPPAAAQ